jgi:DNA primase
MFALRWSAFGSNAYRNEKGETIKQSFANRIIIPVYDLDGVLVTYQGRDVTGTSEIRYRFAGGMPGTGRFLYHGHAARAAGVKTAVICEGVFDVIGAQKAIDGCPQLDGFAPIGTFGKHVSKNDSGPDQITALRRLARLGMTSAVFLWDAEPAAYQAALTASEGLLGLGLEIRVACLPRGLDPGEADARVIQSAIINALPATRTSLLRMRLKNPYA